VLQALSDSRLIEHLLAEGQMKFMLWSETRPSLAG